MTVATKSLTFTELLGAEVGAKFKISTDNSLYGTTVIKTGNAIVNERTGEPIALTADLVNSKFRPVVTEQEVSLGAFLEAYKAGKKLKIEVGDNFRFVQKQDDDLPEELQVLLNMLPVRAFGADDVVSFEELTEGKFYIV